MAPKVRTGGSATTGLAAPPPRNNQCRTKKTYKAKPTLAKAVNKELLRYKELGSV